MRPAACIALVALLVLALSCADRTPAKFNLDPPPTAVTNTSYFSLHASVVNKKGEAIEGLSPAYSAGPPDILEVSANGNLRCAKTGDATLTLSAGGLSERVALKCRIPTEIAVLQEMQLVLGSAPTALQARALGEGGRPLDDVKVEVTSSDLSVVTVESDKVKGVAVGRAHLQVATGGLTAMTQVEVVEKVLSEPLTLRDGASRSFTLQPGYYLVTVELKVDERLKQGVTVGFTGTACENQMEKPSHRFNCRVGETATMTVTNPKLMGLGATVKGTVGVFRVPG